MVQNVGSLAIVGLQPKLLSRPWLHMYRRPCKCIDPLPCVVYVPF